MVTYYMTNMIEVPVLLNFDSEKRIGTMTVDKDKLPKDVNYVFSLGYTIEGATYGGKLCITKHNLVCVSLQSDKEYLNNIGS